MQSFSGALYFSFHPRKYFSLWIQLGSRASFLRGSKTNSRISYRPRRAAIFLSLIRVESQTLQSTGRQNSHRLSSGKKSATECYFGYLNLDRRGRGQADRAEGEAIGRYRDNEDAVDSVVQNGSSCRERVGSGTSGSRNEDAIPSSSGQKFLVDLNLEGYPFVSSPRDVDFVDADFEGLAWFFLSGIKPDSFESHEPDLFKGHFYLFEVIGDQFFKNFLHLVETEAAHEAKRSSLEGDNGRYFGFEFLGSVEDGAVSSDRDDVIDEGVVLRGDELKSSSFRTLFQNFILGAGVSEVQENWRQAQNDSNGLFDEFENQVFFEDAAHHQHCEVWLHPIYTYSQIYPGPSQLLSLHLF